MPERPVTILIYGHDPKLLQTRRWLLEGRGFRTQGASSLEDLYAIEAGIRIDLLVLCYTVNATRCAEVAALAGKRWPGIKRLVLESLGNAPCEALADDPVLGMEGPLKFLATVETLVTVRRDVQHSHIY